MSGEVGASMQQVAQSKTVHVIDKYNLYELEAPSPYIGKSLAEMNIRNNYQLEVMLIKRQKTTKDKIEEKYIQPNANTILRVNDTILLFGKQEDFERFKKAKN